MKLSHTMISMSLLAAATAAPTGEDTSSSSRSSKVKTTRLRGHTGSSGNSGDAVDPNSPPFDVQRTLVSCNPNSGHRYERNLNDVDATDQVEDESNKDERPSIQAQEKPTPNEPHQQRQMWGCGYSVWCDSTCPSYTKDGHAYRNICDCDAKDIGGWDPKTDYCTLCSEMGYFPYYCKTKTDTYNFDNECTVRATLDDDGFYQYCERYGWP